VAKHTGLKNGWIGTKETVSLKDKNRLADVFVGGSEDASVLLLTDDANGDALFINDFFTELPESLEYHQARIAQIKEIRAGAGDDIIDLTSKRFSYIGESMTVKGGAGDDVIWSNKGNNMLFGDAGNDRIVGMSGDDTIVGGAGNDSMHGGGGNDTFVFGGNWGDDSIEQLASGSSLLWFDGIERDDLSLSANDNGDAVLSCASGSVTLVGVKHDDIADAFAAGGNDLLGNLSLKFGDDGSERYGDLSAAGAFNDSTSDKVFEQKGMLA